MKNEMFLVQELEARFEMEVIFDGTPDGHIGSCIEYHCFEQE